MDFRTHATRRPHRRRARASAVALLVPALSLAASCSPPDRPPRLPPSLPDAALRLLEPDTVRVRRISDGVFYRYVWSSRGPWAIHLAEADLNRCELGLDVVRGPGPGHPPHPLSGMPGVGTSLVAVNGDFFTPEGRPLGPELDEGSLRTPRSRPVLSWRPGADPWIGTAARRGDSTLAVGWALPLEEGERPRDAIVVGGWPELLDRGGRVGDLQVGPSPAFAGSRHPRTAVAFDPEARRLWLVVVDGRGGEYSLGMTLPELTELLERLGATEALNLDGGGSSVMVVRGRAVSRPSDEGRERPVVNGLAVRADPAHCRD